MAAAAARRSVIVGGGGVTNLAAAAARRDRLRALYLEKRYCDFSEKLDLLVGIFIIDGDLKDRVNVGHFAEINTTYVQHPNEIL